MRSTVWIVRNSIVRFDSSVKNFLDCFLGRIFPYIIIIIYAYTYQTIDQVSIVRREGKDARMLTLRPVISYQPSRTLGASTYVILERTRVGNRCNRNCNVHVPWSAYTYVPCTCAWPIWNRSKSIRHRTARWYEEHERRFGKRLIEAFDKYKLTLWFSRKINGCWYMYIYIYTGIYIYVYFRTRESRSKRDETFFQSNSVLCNLLENKRTTESSWRYRN